MSTTRRRLGVAGALVGAGAAGVGAAVAVRRYAVGRARLRPDPEADEPLGALRGRPLRVRASDGTDLHVEIDEADAAGEAAAGGPAPATAGRFGRIRPARRFGRRRAARTAPAPLTVVFCHGYALNQDCWHYLRRDLRESLAGAAGVTGAAGTAATASRSGTAGTASRSGKPGGGVAGAAPSARPAGTAELARLVFWDQRGHGRSARGEPGNSTVDQLGDDLRAVLRETVPDGAPVVLVGHSMGGMTIMALADRYPELFGGQVVAVALVSTAAGDAHGFTLGLPPVLGRVVGGAVPGVIRTLGRRARLVERTRRLGGDLVADLTFLATRRFGFVDRRVSPTVVNFVDRMIQATPIAVIADFYAALMDHDKRDALATLGAVPTLVLSGDRDGITPSPHADELAESIPGAEQVEIPDCGHLPMLERPDAVRDELLRLLARAAGSPPSTAERSA